MPSPFDSPQSLHDAFVDGLQRMIDAPGLGAHILVLANAAFDPVIFERLREPLRQRFETDATRIRETFAEGHDVDYQSLNSAAIDAELLRVRLPEQAGSAPKENAFTIDKSAESTASTVPR